VSEELSIQLSLGRKFATSGNNFATKFSPFKFGKICAGVASSGDKKFPHDLVEIFRTQESEKSARGSPNIF